MTMTIRPVSTIEFIGLSETNTIGYYRKTKVAVEKRRASDPAFGRQRSLALLSPSGNLMA
jgi:hypothetical protein